MTVNIPSSEIGGMTLLESSILVCLAKLLNAKNLFEFGTFMGASTVLLAQNTASDARITTLDIPPEESTSQPGGEVLKNGDANDAFLRTSFSRNGARCIQHSNDTIQNKIEQMLVNSLDLDTHKYNLNRRFDFIFIDGGHHFNVIKRDTENAYKMAKEDAIVIWHDFESRIHSDVTTFLNQHSQKRTIHHVENTMIAFELLGKFSTLIPA